MRKSDRDVYREIVDFYEKEGLHELPPQERVIPIGKFFIGFPYRKSPIARESKNHLTVNLREKDCVTFVENTIALLYTLSSPKRSFETFKKILKRIRYREGKIQGYPSRLHYFSEWMEDNKRKGFLKEVTQELGGKPFQKSLHFMTDHPGLYPSLRHPKNFYRMRGIEKRISRKPFFFIPKESLPEMESQIQEGDLIAIVTRKKGLDIQHVGFAEKRRKRVYLLHASEKEGEVTLSGETLYRYLMKTREALGIRIARIKKSGFDSIP